MSDETKSWGQCIAQVFWFLVSAAVAIGVIMVLPIYAVSECNLFLMGLWMFLMLAWVVCDLRYGNGGFIDL